MPVTQNSKYFTEATSLTTTSDTDVYVVPANFSAHVEHFFVSNNSSGGVDYTLKFYHADDATTHTILDTHSVDGKSFESVFTVDKPMFLHAGDKLIVAAGSANKLVATVSVEEHYDPNR